jgi:hypothetical protein
MLPSTGAEVIWTHGGRRRDTGFNSPGRTADELKLTFTT